ncbi:MAG: DNA topoisomerase [Eubacteriales bacterium]
MSKLVLAEKPSVGLAIAKVLGANQKQDGYYEGNGYYISWCVGHLVELARAEYYEEKYRKWSYDDLPILPSNWKFHTASGKEKQMKIITSLMNKVEVDTIICATDAGREGELIFRLVYDKIGCMKPVKRLWISSLEEEAISNVFSNLHDGEQFENLYQAALCRTKADWLVGINATRLFSVLYGQTLHIGRVMSPTLAMIVERNAQVTAFQSEPFYTVMLDFDTFMLTGEKIKDREQAESIAKSCEGKDVVITAVERKEKMEKTPKLYDLTTLQREANKLLGFTAEQTLQYTQSLYEKKLVTYPRTDSRYLTTDMKNSVPAVVDASAGIFTFEHSNLIINVEQVTDNHKVSDHHGIIPTIKVKEFDLEALSFGEREILRLVSMRLLTATNENHRYAETVVTGTCGDYTFTTKGKTSPPKNFTDDTLLSAMENANNAVEDGEKKGIGTPPTRASIMEKLIHTGLVERKGDKKVKYFIPTHKGIALATVLPEEIQSPLLTAEWEEKLKQIEQGKLSANSFLEEIRNMTTSLVKTYECIKGADALFPRQQRGDSVGICPRCGAEVIENKKGFCCSHRECQFVIWKENKFFAAKKKKVTKELVAELLSKGKVYLKGCHSAKTGKVYNCFVFLDDIGGKYVNFRIEFENMT